MSSHDNDNIVSALSSTLANWTARDVTGGGSSDDRDINLETDRGGRQLNTRIQEIATEEQFEDMNVEDYVKSDQNKGTYGSVDSLSRNPSPPTTEFFKDFVGTTPDRLSPAVGSIRGESTRVSSCSETVKSEFNDERKYKLDVVPQQRSEKDGKVAEEDENRYASSFESVERVFCISDLHTDSPDNMKWLEQLCSSYSDNPTSENIRSRSINSRKSDNGTRIMKPGPKDVLIVAGDISHKLDRIDRTLRLLTNKLNCSVFFVPGNHEAWVTADDEKDSLEKLELVNKMCRSIPNVHVNEHVLVGTAQSNPVWICPILSWYDGTLDLGPSFYDLCAGFEHWPWTDFFCCSWPKQFYRRNDTDSNIAMHREMPSTKLVQHFLKQNEPRINDISLYYQETSDNTVDDSNVNIAGLITYSHFLPNQQSLPDWKDLSYDKFQRQEWLDHPVPDISAKFARVAGSSLIDDQLRSIIPHKHKQKKSNHHNSLHTSNTNSKIKHIHVFGHSHRPKDFTYKDIRYVHNPLGKPAEREMNMISTNVSFQLLWDTTLTSSSEADSEGKSGEVSGEQIICYFKEKGGGKKLLARKIKNARTRRGI